MQSHDFITASATDLAAPVGAIMADHSVAKPVKTRFPRSSLWLGLGACALSGLIQAAPVSGVVVDDRGLPIANAWIEVVGAPVRAKTDAQGQFSIAHVSHHHHELHVRAEGFAHRIIHIDHAEAAALSVRLNPSALEIVNVIGLPWHASNIESAQPITVLSGDNLRAKQSLNLGDTLKNEVGVHSTYYGPVAASPIIRGLEGARVLVSQNGLDVGDASRVGPDHAVATEASTARQIEILRGPATLFYGSGAIGGVVNIVDDRVPQSSDLRGEWRADYNGLADDKLVSASATGGSETIALHADGFWRESGDYKLPDDARVEAARLPFSDTQGKGINLGASYLLDEGFVGFAYGRLERNYGIPGHSHDGHAEDHDHDLHDHDAEAPHHDHDHAPDVPVYADLVQDRYQMISELKVDHALINAVNTRVGYTRYRHHEIEQDAITTRFNNDTLEARADIFHHPLADWRGALTLHYKQNDFAAEGLEAFTPASDTRTWALALIEERHFGDVLVQLGARVEDTRIDSFTAQAHNEDDIDAHHDSAIELDAHRYSATPFSLSAGAVWEFTDGYNLALSLTRAERAPAASEIYANGAHLGSGLFEVGALFDVEVETHGDHEHVHVEPHNRHIALETSNNIDLSLRKFNGDLGFIVNVFYNQIDDFYFLNNTGAHYSNSHDHGDHSDSITLPLYRYDTADVRFYGLESEWVWDMDDALKLTLMGDYIRGKTRAGADLPRIPPLRLGARLNGNWQNFSGELSVNRYFAQDHSAASETATAGYTLIDAQVHYALGKHLGQSSLANTRVTLKLQNLTDEYAQVHSSFLKDHTPLPGRAISLGISGEF